MAERACTANAVTHGNGYSSEELVLLSVATEPSRFSITIKDEGDGFNPDEVPDPLDGQNLLKSSVRGAAPDAVLRRRGQHPSRRPVRSEN